MRYGSAVRRLIVLLAAASLLVAGCGGGGGKQSSSKPLTKAEYQAKITQIAKDVAAGVGSTTSSKTISDADVAKLVKVVREFADQLEPVTPPAKVKDLHVQLVAVMRQLAGEFPGIADKLRSAKDPSAAIAALFGAKSIQKLAELQKQFKDKGYDLNLNS